MKHLKYLSYVLRHKWHVAVAGWRLRVPLWNLIIHDWTKFTPAEWKPYADRFFSGRGGVLDKDLDPQAFRDAWRHHWQHNPHHWEYHLDENGEPTEIPQQYLDEMVADWIGAGLAQHKPNTLEWYANNRSRIKLTYMDRVYVEAILTDYVVVYGGSWFK